MVFHGAAPVDKLPLFFYIYLSVVVSFPSEASRTWQNSAIGFSFGPRGFPANDRRILLSLSLIFTRLSAKRSRCTFRGIVPIHSPEWLRESFFQAKEAEHNLSPFHRSKLQRWNRIDSVYL